MRFPHAAKKLLSEVQALNTRAKMTAVGEPDGLGVQRVVRFDKRSSALLDKALPLLEDPRIVDHELDEDGIITITFNHRRIADTKTSFPLGEALFVADN